MGKADINTYNTKDFRERYMQPESQLGSMLKAGFGKFFIVKVEEMLRLISLPVPPTRATTHTLIFLNDGEAVMTIGSETYNIYKNECLIVPAGQVFSFNNLDINRGFLCNFHDDFITGKFGKRDLLRDFEFLSVWGNPRISPDQLTSNFIATLLSRMYNHYSQNGLSDMCLIQSGLIALLCEIDHVYQPLSESKQIPAIAISNKFKNLLFSHIKSKHMVSDYSEMLNISPSHLNRVVKQITGKSPARWINETLMMEAKILLNQTHLTIQEIAEETGIFDPSYFSRIFKKHEGVTPQQFRKTLVRDA